MKKLCSLLLATILAVPALLAAEFEGVVKMKLSAAAGAPAPEMAYSIKGTATRLDIATATKGGNVAMLMDSTKSEMTILMLDRKMFMKQDIPKAVTDAVQKGEPEAKVEKTSITEKILGYDCTKYIATTKTGTTEMWLTEQLGAFPGLGQNNPMAGGGRGGKRGGSAPSALGWENALAGMNAFPLRVMSHDGAKEVFRMEATAVEKKTLPDSTFVPPSDFQDLSAMMRGMGGFGK